MSVAGKAKRHHYVPRCYLNNFLSGEHVFVLDVKNVKAGWKEKPKMRHPNSICIDDQYYSIKPEHRGTNFRLESFDELYVETEILQELENRYQKIFNELISKPSLKMTDAVYFCDFIVQMKTRNLYWANEVIQPNKEKWVDDSISQIIAEKGQFNQRFSRLPPELQQYVIESVRGEQKQNATFEKQLQLFGLIQRTDGDNNEKYRESIINCQWTLLTAPMDGPFFITSDNPGFARSAKGLFHNSYFGADGIFYFPLSPSFCLKVTGSNLDNAYSANQNTKLIASSDISTNEVIHINNGTIQRINRLLIASDTWYLDQIAKLNNPNSSSAK